MPRRALILLGLACSLGCSDATDPPDLGLVRGTVHRAYSDQAIAGATVQVAGLTQVTDTNGTFQFDHVEQGAQVLAVSADGYGSHTRGLAVSSFQSLDVALMPLDSLVTVVGQVRHRADGPVRVELQHPGGVLLTDADGRWSLADVPLGPLALVIDHPGYNRLEVQPVIQVAGQEIDLVLTRDAIVTRWVTDDSYIFTDSDSLNANRGQRSMLHVSHDLGRRAVFSAPRPGDLDGGDIVAASLVVHGAWLPEGPDDPLVPPVAIDVSVGWLDATFLENSIDYFNRPGVVGVARLQLSLAAVPAWQEVSLEIGDLFLNGGEGGVTLSVGAGQPAFGVLSGEAGVDGSDIAALRPRIDFLVRY